MSVGGIGGNAHIGASQSTRSANTLKTIGSAAFNVAMDAATIGASAFGGQAAGSAVSSLRGLGNSAIGSAGAGLGPSGAQQAGVGQAVDSIQNNNASNISGAVAANDKAQSFQMDLFMLQSAVNSQSQTNNTISNMQKAKHDAAMATIQNTR